MADLAPIDRLQPCLLDRLTDDDPGTKVEGRNMRVVTLARFREGVLRDLRWLFNTERPDAAADYDEFPEVKKSVLNFGVRNYSGVYSEGGGLQAVEREILESLRTYEPRILSGTLQVRVLPDEEGGQRNPHRVQLQISADLWAQPLPEKFLAKTVIDLETGECRF